MINFRQENYANDTQKTIMAVDNAPLMPSILRSIIVGGGYNFTRAKSSKDAIRMVESKKPDLLILRTAMDDMDGYELAKTLKARGNTVPMIFLSDSATKDSVVKAHQAGAKDYITNTIDRDTLLSKIAKQIA